jgi:aarF domain-containing kinase
MQSKELVDMVGLDPAEFEDAGFMDGFASVLTNLSNPSSSSDNAADRERVLKIRKLNEQVKFRLPPYFVLILRAFSVIEGIALKVDPQYSIINETFPYLSRRLLTDDNEEVRRSLRQMLYGDGKRMDLLRFSTLFDSLQSFSTDGLTSGGGDGEGRKASVRSGGLASTSRGLLDKNTLLALQSVFKSSGSSYIQELLVSELAATLDALSRGAAVALLQRALQSSLMNGTLALLERLGPMRRLLFPFPLPAEVISQLGGVVTLTQDDEVAIQNVQTVWGFLQPQLAESFGQGNMQMSLLRSFASTVGELPSDTRSELIVGAGRTSQMVLEKVVQRTAARFVEDIASVRGQQSAINGAIGGGLVPSQAEQIRYNNEGASAARVTPRQT